MSIFKNAASKAPVKPTKAKTAKVDPTITLSGLEAFASICAFEKALESIKKTLEGDLKAAGVAIMVTDGIAIARRPENLKAVEGLAEASVQLRCKASNIPLSAEDAERITAHDIPLKTIDKVTDTFIINPAYATDEKLLDKVSRALEKVPGLPEDFIQKQEDKVVIVDGDNTLNALFALTDDNGKPNRDLIEGLLPLVTSTSIRPKLNAELETAIENVASLLGVSLSEKPKPSKAAKKAAKGAECPIAA